jgi:uncharacterized protein (DUF427 family)
MALTMASGPFGTSPTGTFYFTPPPHVTFVEPLGRRLRGALGGRTVVDSHEARLLHETGKLPRYLVPEADTEVAGEPHPATPGHVTVPWDAVDAWFEEDERVLGHPRDPYHRIDTFATSRRVEIRLAGVLLASSTRPRVLCETSLPARWYLPRADVRVGLLVRSDTVTQCAYKGTANHWSAALDSGVVPDVAWSYDDEVRREAEDVRGMLCFYDERVDVAVDGVARERPHTAWSR